MKKAYINGNIITGDSKEPLITNGCVVVNDIGKIQYVGKKTSDAVPNDMDVVDLKGKFVMPGLINAHTHMFTLGNPVTSMDSDRAAKAMKFLRTRMGKKLMKKLYKRNTTCFINAGVTTIREVGSYLDYDIKMRKHIEKGEIVGPRILCSGGIITPTGGHACDFPGTIVADGPIEFRKAVRHNYHVKADWIKICNTGGVADSKFVGEAGMPHMTLEEIEAVCEEAHKRNLMVASHCESTEGIRDALLAGVDTIEHGADFDEELSELFKNNPKALRGYTSLIPTLTAPLGLVEHKDEFEDNEGNRILLENAHAIMDGCISGYQKAIKYGVSLGMGTDASVPGVTPYNTYKELIQYKIHSSLSNSEIIELATKKNAEVLNISHITGMVKEGLDADFIVLNGNPLEDFNTLKLPYHVVVRGYLIEKPEFQVVEGLE